MTMESKRSRLGTANLSFASLLSYMVSTSTSNSSGTNNTTDSSLGRGPDESYLKQMREGNGCVVMQRRTRESSSIERVLVTPSPDVLREFQGGWEQVPRCGQGPVEPWLRSFVITGRFITCSDGSSDALPEFVRTGDVLFRGGVLRRENGTNMEGLLTWTAESGETALFKRFVLPSIDAVQQFQGAWPISKNGRTVPNCCLNIRGRMWQFDEDGGFLTEQNGRVMVNGYKLVPARGPHGDPVMTLLR
eukprot:CAMPEP_0117457420 /NCGR_PEP_ID=MMETSP0784-20121206/391_1 /TAXON_ID=39447 /ORGANISM="" /LENGTH=246 /DNA_ID=CAMNT_0005250877 /DNA_START=23 /DNA_END=763 /DNA_ORIENTATION=-